MQTYFFTVVRYHGRKIINDKSTQSTFNQINKEAASKDECLDSVSSISKWSAYVDRQW